MLKFIYCDTNVTPELQSQIERLLQECAHQIIGNNAALFLQQLLNKQLGEKWSVFQFKYAEDVQYVIESNTNILLEVDLATVKLLISQSKDTGFDSLPKDSFVKHCQYAQEMANVSEGPLGVLIRETHNYLKSKLKGSVSVVMCLQDPNTQLQHSIPQGTHEQQFVVPIDEQHQIHAIIYHMNDGNQNDANIYNHSQESEDNNVAYLENDNGGELVEDEYEEPMDQLFQVQLEEITFRQSTDQLKVSFDQLEIQPLKLKSFSIIFQVLLNQKDIKDDLNIFSTGSTLMSKNMTFGINKESLFFFTFQLINGRHECLYSQIKVKRSQYYQIALVYQNTDFYKEVSLYVNGKIENQISISQGIEPPRGFFWLGSEQALKLFRGSIQDAVFVASHLHHKHLKSIYAELQASQGRRATIEIIQEVLATLKDDIPQDQDPSRSQLTNLTALKSLKQPKQQKNKKAQIPQQLQKSYHLYEDIQDKKVIKDINQPKTMKQLAQSLHDVFLENEYLFNRCHEMSINFQWVFTTVQLLAPPLEENSQPRLPFEYLHQSLCKERFEQYPVYAIELARLAQVIHHAGITLSNDEILQLAHITESIRTNKDYGYYVIYDKFLLTIREAALTQQEIEMVQAQYNTDEKEQDMDLLVVSDGIKRIKGEVPFNFSFFEQLQQLVGQQQAFKYNIQYLLAYFVQGISYVQKLTAVYLHKETQQEVEIEGVEFFSFEQDKIYYQKLDISDEVALKYFRVHYNGDYMAMVAFKTHQAEETFLLDRNFRYLEGQDATGLLETYAIDSLRLAGFKGTLQKDQNGLSQLVILHAEYLKKDPRVEELKRSLPESLPQLPDTWNQGRFQIVVNRCTDCSKHSTTTWHDETDFALKFNELGQIIKDLFPNAEVVGNWDRTQQLEHFDVYIRGVGMPSRWDKESRIFLLRKNETLKSFLNHFLSRILRVYDQIVLIAQAYGDTIEMAKRQELVLKNFQRPKQAQDHPCTVPDRIEKPTKDENQQQDYICKNWGCGEPFKFESTPSGLKKCKHHPGRYEFGSKHGLWPECWTCCGKPWEAEGCRMDYHKGVPEKEFYQVCINIGQPDPRTGFPNEVCGMRYQEGDGSDCKLGGSHQTAKWPDLQAKILFFQKTVQNPALKDQPHAKTVLKPDMFRETVPYKEFINKDRQRQMKLIETENELRQCTNWACGKQYMEIENRKKRSCICHPGVFDFGHTATTIQQAVEEYRKDKDSKLLWRPHWTCCRKPFAEGGCSLQQHSGPLVKEYTPKEYNWPDPNAQIYFKKKVSQNWTHMLQNFHSLTPDQASMKYDLLCKSVGSGASISIYKLPELCDKFKLNLWVCSEDLSFQFKFQDVLEGKAQTYLTDNSNNIDKHKFLDWWFADLGKLKEMRLK